MVDPRFREIYFQFYKETYKPSVLDRKTKELVAIAASLAAKCQGCLEGHIKKAQKFGATREEISESIAIAIGRERGRHRGPHRHRRREHEPQDVLTGNGRPASPREPAAQALLPRASMTESLRISARASKMASPSSAEAAVGSPK